MRPTKVTLTTAGSGAESAWIPLNWRQAGFEVGIQVDVTAESPTWVLQITHDDVFDTSVTPTAITLAAPFDTGTGDEHGVLTIPCTAIRLTHSASSGTSVMTVVQGG